MLTPLELTKLIKDFALNEAGFDLVGASRAALAPRHEAALDRFLEDGFAGGMEYLGRDARRRAHPEVSLEGARSVISLALNYYHPEDEKPAAPAGKVAKYAYGADYHPVIEKKLKKLSKFIVDISAGVARVKAYVDTGPVLEKAFAQNAGLAFFGKNTNVITRDYGSWVFLASLITDLELAYDAPHEGGCGSCRICIDACPTEALLGDYRLDARRCISYLTIESRGQVPPQMERGVGEWIFGCDVCQDVCPYNHRAKPTRHSEFSQKKAGTWLSLDDVRAIADDDAFSERFRGSAVKRAKLVGLKRNAEIVAQNRTPSGREALRG